MSDHVDEILALIDGALGDELSPDAVRWSPDIEKATGSAVEVLTFAEVEALFDRARPRWYDREGRPLTIQQWALLLELHGDEYRRVAADQVGDVVVSTVWLGIDHNWLFAGPPIIFETMTFHRNPEIESGMWRYSTEIEALEGHERIVQMLTEEQRQIGE